jgi:hypothetical protein
LYSKKTLEGNLPIAAAVSPAPTTTSSAPTTVATARSATPAVAATSSSPSAGTFPLRTRFIDNERPAKKVFPIQRRDRLFSFRVVANFSKAKSTRLARKTITKQRERVRLHADF